MKTIAPRVSIFLATVALCLSAALAGTAALTPSTAPSTDNPAILGSIAQKAAIIDLKGEINDYTRDTLEHNVDVARAAGANVIILNIDTYGGLVTAGLEMSRFMKRQNDLHTIAYVEDKAISAGSMIAMSCDEIVMSDSASLGDCAPIVLGPDGLQALPAAERAKMESPILQDFNNSAIRNHHDPLLAAAMVSVADTVYWVQDDAGNKKFVNDVDYKQLIASGKWKDVPGAPVPVDGPDTLLTVDGLHAVQYGLATGNAVSAESLAAERGYQIVTTIHSGWGEAAVEFLGSSVVRGILILLFILCFYFVIHAPGHGVAEVCGLVALILMLGVPLLTGYAEWWEILLIFMGLALVAMEILLPGHLFPGITGLILVLAGTVLTFVPMLPWDRGATGHAWPAIERGLMVVTGAVLASFVVWAWLGRNLPSLPYFNKLILTQTSGKTPVVAGGSHGSGAVATAWPPRGAIGRAVSELRPSGSAQFFDPDISDQRRISVVSAGGIIPAGTEIVVMELSGPSVLVRPNTQTAAV